MELLVLSNVPNIAVKVVSTDNPPTGGGAGASAGALSILSLESLLLAPSGGSWRCSTTPAMEGEADAR